MGSGSGGVFGQNKKMVLANVIKLSSLNGLILTQVFNGTRPKNKTQLETIYPTSKTVPYKALVPHKGQHKNTR